MSQTAEPLGAPRIDVPRTSYGDYILRTGTGVVGELETLYGNYWYHKQFIGKKPILDLGPGRCWFTKQNVEDIVAVDNAPDLVAHYRKQGINAHVGDAYQVPFADKHFQGVFCCWLFEHLTEPQRALAELHRVLEPGGYACIIVPSSNDITAFYDDYTHVRPYTSTSLMQLAEDSGFQTHRVQYLPFTRGITVLIRLLGSESAQQYLRFSDVILRRTGLANRNHLMLEAWA